MRIRHNKPRDPEPKSSESTSDETSSQESTEESTGSDVSYEEDPLHKKQNPKSNRPDKPEPTEACTCIIL